MENCLSIIGSQQAELAKTSGQTKQQIHAWMASASDHACSKFALSCRMAGLTVTGDWIAYEYGIPPVKANTALAILLAEFEQFCHRTITRLRIAKVPSSQPLESNP
jgi:hypothetical protein